VVKWVAGFDAGLDEAHGPKMGETSGDVFAFFLISGPSPCERSLTIISPTEHHSTRHRQAAGVCRQRAASPSAHPLPPQRVCE
jgi:hypothetical protein